MKYTYLFIDIGTAIIPFLFSYHRKLRFSKNFKAFFAANLITAVVFIFWDFLFTGLNVWGFNERYLCGIQIANLPLEEVLFFVCIPFACLFTYHCINLFYSIAWNSKTEKRFVLIFSFILLIAGLARLDRLYTSTTFISLSLLLLYIKFIAKAKFLPKLFIVYPVLLVPFFIVNGLLTGSVIEQPIVYYNPNEYLGIRLGTIPVEDIFYGFELILLNVFLYEYFLKRWNSKLPIRYN